MDLKIIYTNDIHSNFENFAKISTLIKQHTDDNLLVLDAGDFVDFKSIEYYATDGLAAVELLEAAHYDAITVGNNEMFKTVDALKYMATNSKVPFITCNILNSDNERILGTKASIIVKKNPLKILVIGVSPYIKKFNKLFGFNTIDYIEATKKEMELHKGNYDICILLNHIGSQRDIELAQLIDGINIIISAHDHAFFDTPLKVNDTIITSTGAYGDHVGIINIEYAGEKVVLKDSTMIETKNLESDIEILNAIEKNKKLAIKKISTPLYSIEKSLWHDVVEENPISNLIADSLRDIFNCELGLINSGIVNGGIIQKIVTEKKILELCPSPLNPTLIEIQGKNLLEALESSLDPAVCMKDGIGSGFRGKYLGRLHISGAEIKYKGNKIIEVLINGEKIDGEKWYKVATSDYLQRGTGYPTLGENRNAKYLSQQIKLLFKEYASKSTFVEKAFLNRWVELS